MADLLQMDTDEEIDKYDEATLIASNPPPLATTKNKMAVYNPLNGRNDVLVPLSLGGYVKLGEEPVDRLAEVRDYADTLQQKKQLFDMADYEAAGFTQKEVEDAGIIPQGQEPSPRTEPLREGEELRMRRAGAEMVKPDDPTMRKDLTRLTFENTEGDLRQIFEVLGIDRSTARKMAEGLWGNPESTRDLGLGIADFTPAGLFFGAQEGMRTFERGRNTGDPLTIGMGALEAGLSFLEALPLTTAGAKALKASMPAIRNALTELGRRMNQPGDMPTTSSFGVGSIDDAVKQAKQAVLDNPGDEELLGEYTRLLKERSDVKDASAVARAAARGDVAVAEPPTETEPGIIAFHGSGADFDQFKLDKINTGEGAQAFGYGLYFTDSENIAEFYKSAVRQAKDLREGYDVTYKGKPFINLGDTPEAEAQGYEYSSINKIIDNLNKVTTVETKQLPQPQLIQLAKDRAIKDTEREIEITKLTYPTTDIVEGSGFDEISQIILDSLNDELDALKAIDANDLSFSTGKTYQVGLDVKPDELLDYDKPFDEQTPFVQRAIAKVLNEITIDDAFNLGVDLFSPPYNGNTEMAIRDAQKLMLDNFTAVRFLNDWSVLRGVENSGEELLEKHGVKGIKYKANRGPGSRNVPETGSDNYVIFDDKLISIMKKYGIVGPVAVSAMTSQKQEEI